MKNLIKNGPVIMFISTIFYSLMALFAKILTKTFNSSQIVFVRFFVTFLFISLLFLTKKAKFKIVNKKAVILRGIFGGLAISLFFTSFSFIPLGRATLLNYMYPVTATIASYIFLKERIKKNAVIALVIALIGLIIIRGFDGSSFLLGDLIAITSSVCAGIAVMFIRKSRQTDSTIVILYSLGFFGSLMIAPFTFSKFVLPSLLSWSLLLAMAFMSIAGQLSMTYAFKFCKASTGSIISLMTVVLANLWGIIFLKEIPSFAFIIGGLLVLGSTIYMMEIKNIAIIFKKSAIKP